MSRTLGCAVLAATVAVSFAASANAAAPKVIKGSWTAQATPDPSGDSPVGNAKCAPTVPTARATKSFTVPGPGVLEVHLNNALDWSGDVRDAKSGDVLADSDGGNPNDPESMALSFRRKTAVVLGACNLEGEPQITVTYTFTPKKR